MLDRQTGQTEYILLPDGYRSPINETISISDDGRYVALEVFEEITCVPPFPCPQPVATDVFVHDRTTGTNEQLPIPESFERATEPSISGNGHRIAFHAGITVQEPGGPLIEVQSTWVYDRLTQSTEPVSVFPDGTSGKSSVDYLRDTRNLRRRTVHHVHQRRVTRPHRFHLTTGSCTCATRWRTEPPS